MVITTSAPRRSGEVRVAKSEMGTEFINLLDIIESRFALYMGEQGHASPIAEARLSEH